MPKITAVIISRNEESRIREALRSVQVFVDEIVVVDDMSTDETCSIAEKEFKAKVFRRPSEGDLSRQRNFGADQATHPWILIMDADEVFSPESAARIAHVLADPGEHVAFMMPRLNHLMGHPIRYAGNASLYILRLYRKDKVRYREPGVHHEWDINGTVGQISVVIHHFPFDTATQMLEKGFCYGEYEAMQYVRENKSVSIQEIKYRLGWRSLKLFWKIYVKKQGFRDGVHGLVWCVCNVIGPQIKWIKIWEKAQKAGKLVK